ncbi:MAG: hypothetical protein AAFZ15_02580 [Bacteroidota bacterium]
MIHLLGYGALVLNLTSMAMKDVIRLRLFSLIANAIYILYGILLNAPPFIIGCSIAVLIHGYHLWQLFSKRKVE